MPVSFTQISVGTSYSRSELARLWGYAGFQALARGVVTPRDDNKIILFVTHEKQSGNEQYDDVLSGMKLEWEGPTDHFAEDRMLDTSTSNEEIHLFYRERHHSVFIYQGPLRLIRCEQYTDRPSRFVFQIK